MKIWMLCRHGARNMAKGEFVRYGPLVSVSILSKFQENPMSITRPFQLRRKIIKNYNEPNTFMNEYKRCKMCDADYQLIKNWDLKRESEGSTMLKAQVLYTRPYNYNVPKSSLIYMVNSS